MRSINVILGFTFIIIGVISIVLGYPLYKEKIKMNHFYGFRIKKAFESEDNWYKINKIGGKLFSYFGIIIFLFGIITFLIPFNNNQLFLNVYAIAPFLVVIPIVIKVYKYSKSL